MANCISTSSIKEAMKKAYYNLARMTGGKTRDLDKVRCIKDGNGLGG